MLQAVIALPFIKFVFQKIEQFAHGFGSGRKGIEEALKLLASWAATENVVEKATAGVR